MNNYRYGYHHSCQSKSRRHYPQKQMPSNELRTRQNVVRLSDYSCGVLSAHLLIARRSDGLASIRGQLVM